MSYNRSHVAAVVRGAARARTWLALVVFAGASVLVGCEVDHESVVASFLEAARRGDTATMKSLCVDEALATVVEEERAIQTLVQLEQQGRRLPEDVLADGDEASADGVEGGEAAQPPASGPPARRFDFAFDLLPERTYVSDDGRVARVAARLARHRRSVVREFVLVKTDAGQWKIQSWTNTEDE